MEAAYTEVELAGVEELVAAEINPKSRGGPGSRGSGLTSQRGVSVPAAGRMPTAAGPVAGPLSVGILVLQLALKNWNNGSNFS